MNEFIRFVTNAEMGKFGRFFRNEVAGGALKGLPIKSSCYLDLENVSTVPELSSALLTLASVMILGFRRKRKSRAHST